MGQVSQCGLALASFGVSSISQLGISCQLNPGIWAKATEVCSTGCSCARPECLNASPPKKISGKICRGLEPGLDRRYLGWLFKVALARDELRLRADAVIAHIACAVVFHGDSIVNWNLVRRAATMVWNESITHPGDPSFLRPPQPVAWAHGHQPRGIEAVDKTVGG